MNRCINCQKKIKKINIDHLECYNCKNKCCIDCLEIVSKEESKIINEKNKDFSYSKTFVFNCCNKYYQNYITEEELIFNLKNN